MSKAGYSLIVIGLVLLAYNYGLIDFSVFNLPLFLPTIFIIAGAFQVLKGVINLGDIGEVISSLLGIILFISIIMNIFNLPLMFSSRTVEPIVNLSESSLSASFASLDFSAVSGRASINYEKNNNNYIESSDYEKEYSIYNSFSESAYDFSNFIIDSLVFENSFGDSRISNLGIPSSYIKNSFGEVTIRAEDIIGQKELRIDNSFGSAAVIIDSKAAYKIESSNSFGSIKNSIGLESPEYPSAENRIRIIIENSFGTVELLKQ